MKQLQVGHQVAGSPADAIGQWFNAGGMVQYYDYPLETLMEVRRVINQNQNQTNVEFIGYGWTREQRNCV